MPAEPVEHTHLDGVAADVTNGELGERIVPERGVTASADEHRHCAHHKRNQGHGQRAPESNPSVLGPSTKSCANATVSTTSATSTTIPAVPAAHTSRWTLSAPRRRSS